jgi:hypothetical protein
MAPAVFPRQDLLVKREFAIALLRKAGWIALLVALLGLPGSSAQAQALFTGRSGRGISIYEFVEGSASPSGSLLRADSQVGFDMSRLLGFDVSVPIYFVIPPVQQNNFSLATPSLGSVAADARLSLPLPLVEYQATATIAFPTGSMSKGLSTGTVTYDLDNHFEHGFGLFSAFLDADVGNSLNNGIGPFRSQVQLPYLTLGYLVEGKVGPRIHIIKNLNVTADAFDVVPWGPQTVFSRILRPGSVGMGGTHGRVYELFPRSDGGAGLVKDDGYEASVDYIPARFLKLSFLDIALGFNHSAHYDLNTISLGIGINISQLLRHRTE